MRHELGYILGQMQNPGACETLIKILSDDSEDQLVRHEVSVCEINFLFFDLIMLCL